MTVTGVEIRQAYEMWKRVSKPDRNGEPYGKWRRWLDPNEDHVIGPDHVSDDNYECSETVARKIKLLCSPNEYALCKAMMAQQDD